MKTSVNADTTASAVSTDAESDDELTPLRCWDCNVNFTSKYYLYAHLFHHIKQPVVVLERAQLPPLKITLKSKSGSFEVINSPSHSGSSLGSPSENNSNSAVNLAENKEESEHAEGGEIGEEDTFAGFKLENVEPVDECEKLSEEVILETVEGDETRISFSPNFANVELTSPANSETSNAADKTTDSILTTNSASESNASEYGSIPGAEPTPPPEPSPDYPKIRIKTTGLLKEPLTITEITDDNPDGDPHYNSEDDFDDDDSIADPNFVPDEERIENQITDSESDDERHTNEGDNVDSISTQNESCDNPNQGKQEQTVSNLVNSNAKDQNSNMWTTPSLEDPLKLPDNDDNNIMSLFNNNERAKDLGFHTSDSEFISLDRLEERNRGAMQLYNPSTSQGQSPLDSLTGLPMQALAQQVSRLQPSGGNGLHQQNVLINIQQFPSGPPQPSYQPPPMYPHYPPHPGQPMHQPYQYQPPNPMYYPPAPPGYPPQHMPPPPQPQMNQMGQPPMNQQQMGQPQMGQPQMNQNQNQLPPSSQPQNMNQMPQQSTPYRQTMPPRQGAPRQPTPGNRMPGAPRPPMGQRQPIVRQRAPMVRPRGVGMTAVRGMRPRMGTPQNGVRPPQSPIKRSPEQMQALQAKKKRFDLLTPDKDDDDCQVICMQPKNTDGGLPQIESVQGGTAEPAESSIMHLSDSITLSVRNPPPKPASPKKSDAKAVANILATRGITVTATAKPKDKPESPQKSPTMPSSLNLNGAVSIIPAAKSNGSPKGANSNESLLTVDLTDDTGPSPHTNASPQKQRPGLPYRCDLCPAQYPNAIGLNKHRQSYHKTTGGMCELGIPLINLKQPGILQKLSTLGINNYIPLPASGPDGMFALPIISTRNPGNVSGIGSTTMLSLGPIRSIPKPQNNVGNINAAKQLTNQKS